MASVVVWRSTPVSVFVTVTVADGKIALVASVTVPFISPADIWACGRTTRAQHKTRKRTILIRTAEFLIFGDNRDDFVAKRYTFETRDLFNFKMFIRSSLMTHIPRPEPASAIPHLSQIPGRSFYLVRPAPVAQ